MTQNINIEDLKKAFGDVLRETGRDINLNSKTLIEDLTKFDKQIKSNTSTAGGLFKEMLTGRQVYKDMTGDLKRLNEQIDDLADSADESEIEIRKELVQRRKAVENLVVHNAAQKAVVEGLTGLTGKLANLTGQSIGKFASGLQSGSSAFALAGGIMEAGLDAANAGAQTLAGGLAGVGAAASMSKGRIGKLGMAASIAAPLISKLGDAAAATGKFIVNFMVKEIEKTVEAFNKASAAGALFADGMTGMVDSATKAGLTVQQFSEVLSEHSASLGASGLGVAEAAKQMGGVGRVMRETGVTTNLLKLGYGFKEQAGLVAETMRDMAGVGGPLRASNAQVAKETEKYAENLRVISGITGEDAKAKVDASRKKASQLAFQQKLAGLGETQRLKVMAGFYNMSEMQQDNFMDMVNFNQVLNERGAIATANSEAMSKENEALFSLFQSGTMDAESVRQVQKTYSAAVREDLVNNQSIVAIATAQAAGVGGIIGELGKVLGAELEWRQKNTPEAIKAAEEAAKAQKIANDKLTTSVVTAAEDAQKLAIALQTLVLPALAEFANYSKIILSTISGALDDFMKTSGKPPIPKGPGMFQSRGKEWGGTIGAGITGGLYATGAGAATVATGGLAAPSFLGLGAAMAGGGLTGLMYGEDIGKFLDETTLGKWLNEKFGGSSADQNGQTGPNIAGGNAPIIPGGIGVNGRQGSLPITSELQQKLYLLAKAFPGSTITGLNDADLFPAHANTSHGKGRAVDFSLPRNITGDVAAGEQVVAQLRAMGFGPGTKDEYNWKSPNWNGPHMHAELQDGGIVTGTGGGITARIGEAGRSELVTPLKNGRIPGMDEMIDRLDSMIDLLKSQKDISENILIVSS